MTVRDRREQHELASGHLETLLADPAFTQQHRLPAVEQCVHHRAPPLERGGGFRHFIASRRNGGEGFRGRRGWGGGVLGGGGGGGRLCKPRPVFAATSAAASPRASAWAEDGWVMPLTLRT